VGSLGSGLIPRAKGLYKVIQPRSKKSKGFTVKRFIVRFSFLFSPGLYLNIANKKETHEALGRRFLFERAGSDIFVIQSEANTVQEAEAIGLTIEYTAKIAAMKNRFGIDCRKRDGGLTQAGIDALSSKTGTKVFNGKIGLDIISENIYQKQFLYLFIKDNSKSITTGKSADNFISDFLELISFKFEYDDRVCAIINLLNSSFFDINEEAVFLIRMSTIEAMLTRKRYPKIKNTITNYIVPAINSLNIPDPLKSLFKIKLLEISTESITRAFKRNAVMRGQAEKKAVENLYRYRSDFVHGNKLCVPTHAPSQALEISINLIMRRLASNSRGGN
jgi:hypothetical protein